MKYPSVYPESREMWDEELLEWGESTYEPMVSQRSMQSVLTRLEIRLASYSAGQVPGCTYLPCLYFDPRLQISLMILQNSWHTDIRAVSVIDNLMFEDTRKSLSNLQNIPGNLTSTSSVRTAIRTKLHSIKKQQATCSYRSMKCPRPHPRRTK